MKTMLKTIATPIALLFSCRMLGLFMLIPIFTLYANDLKGATPFLIGVALGSYGLSQALLQIPFGLWSDHYGRQRMILIGLIMLCIGSLIGAFTHHIYGIIFARILQGAGAIGSVLMALLADLTTEKQRTIAMAMIGSMIGISFSIAFIISPILAHHFGLSGVFLSTAGLSLIGLIILYRFLPMPSSPQIQSSYTSWDHLKKAWYNPQLYRFNIGIFCQHFMLTSLFFIVPIQLNVFIKNNIFSSTWHFYLPVLLLSFLCMIPIVYWAEKKYHSKKIFIASIFSIMISQLLLLFNFERSWIFVASLFIYFTGFNILEALLPSSISKVVDPSSKGTAMGIYSSFQFFGIFCGGSIAGFLYSFFGSAGVLICNLILSLGWIFILFCNCSPLRGTSFRTK